MGVWNKKFKRYEIHFGYKSEVDPLGVQLLHMARDDSAKSRSAAEAKAKGRSIEHKFYCKVYDALEEKVVALYLDGEKLDLSRLDELKEEKLGTR